MKKWTRRSFLEAGVMDFLDRLAGCDAKAAAELRQSLGPIEGLSQRRFKASFASFSDQTRTKLLSVLEQQDPKLRVALWSTHGIGPTT